MTLRNLTKGGGVVWGRAVLGCAVWGCAVLGCAAWGCAVLCVAVLCCGRVEGGHWSPRKWGGGQVVRKRGF